MNTKQVMKNFSLGEEELFRAFLFTNPHGKDGFVYPQGLVAGEEMSPLMSAISRTHVPTQERVLQFLDSAKYDKAQAMLPYIRSLMDIFRRSDGTLYVSRRTMDFNREWVLSHGHNSIKEGATFFGHCEDISDIASNHILGHPLCRPQGKSTRYISYERVLDLVLQDDDVRALGSDKFFEHLGYLNKRYLEVSEFLADKVFRSGDTSKIVEYLKKPEQAERELQRWMTRKKKHDPDFAPSESDIESERHRILNGLEEKNVQKDVGKFVLDYSRVYLPAGTRTSIVFSADARTLEDILTSMISSVREEDKKRGYSLWNEARKLAPVLLGSNSHVHVDEWRVNNETELRELVCKRFGSIPYDHDGDAVKIISPRDIEMYSDRFNAALVAFTYLNMPFMNVYEALNENDVTTILEKAHKNRGVFDVLHPSISHGGLMVELKMPYHSFRDMFRHRRGSRTTQLLTTDLGFETPEVFRIFGIEDDYAQDMRRSMEVYKEASKVNKHAAEKLVPFGFNCRSLQSWQPNQIGYVVRLRSNVATGNLSYVRITRELGRQLKEIMPDTAAYLRFDGLEYPPELWKRGYEWYDEQRRGN